jgi:hypothetical protein
MPSHYFHYPKVVPVVAGPSPHREDEDAAKPPVPAKDADDDPSSRRPGR